ncbi:L-threonylcarbamoyladenylate synthase [Dethiothermospora halolimnae]|uniref:L-threonylcarbamoyladenylate synthase n=1 Tax=Dethiothermospora halolimnae TaxID=3114390 RepID=UPI003CCC2E1E
MDLINTKILKIDNENPDKDKIKEAARILKSGGTVAFPTETVYGLGANALNEDSIDKIFNAKGRPQDNPLIVHIADIDQINKLVKNISKRAKTIMEKFWPGPLTVIFDKSDIVPYKVTGGLETIAIRMPNHKIALSLIKEANLPIAAPSANISGKPSPTESSHVIQDLSGKIDMVIDGGNTGVGLESTVLDLSGDIPTILRPGGITIEDLLTVFDKVDYDKALENNDENLKPKSPGQKYRHYSPNAKMTIIKGNENLVSKEINKLTKKYEDQGLKVGIMATEEMKDKYENGEILVVGSKQKTETIAKNLFDTLRKFDKLKVDIILAEAIDEKGIGKAIMNRMGKASQNIVKVE